MAAATALILGGPGKWSADRALGLRLPRWLAPLGLVLIILTVMYAGTGNSEPEQDDPAEQPAEGDEA